MSLLRLPARGGAPAVARAACAAAARRGVAGAGRGVRTPAAAPPPAAHRRRARCAVAAPPPAAAADALDDLTPFDRPGTTLPSAHSAHTHNRAR
jgi:hypothetical protein